MGYIKTLFGLQNRIGPFHPHFFGLIVAQEHVPSQYQARSCWMVLCSHRSFTQDIRDCTGHVSEFFPGFPRLLNRIGTIFLVLLCLRAAQICIPGNSQAHCFCGHSGGLSPSTPQLQKIQIGLRLWFFAFRAINSPFPGFRPALELFS